MCEKDDGRGMSDIKYLACDTIHGHLLIYIASDFAHLLVDGFPFSLGHVIHNVGLVLLLSSHSPFHL